jgi:hypothetical protein
VKYLSLLLLINFINAQESEQTQPTTPPSPPQDLGYDPVKEHDEDLKRQAAILPC